MPSAGAAIVAPIAAVIADRYGRKPAMFASSVLCLGGILLQSASFNGFCLHLVVSYTVSMLLISRFIIGIGIGIANVACSTYVAETGQPNQELSVNPPQEFQPNAQY